MPSVDRRPLERQRGALPIPDRGRSLVRSFHDAGAPELRETQYFKMLGNRGMYHHRWTACTKHATPGVLTGQFPSLDADGSL